MFRRGIFFNNVILFIMTKIFRYVIMENKAGKNIDLCSAEIIQPLQIAMEELQISIEMHSLSGK